MSRVIVSLTSYGKNKNRLAPKAIVSLMRQSIKPDFIVLWLGYGERPGFALRLLRILGLRIMYTEDVGPFTKIVPSLKEFPYDIIVTADDDIIYPRDWLVKLVDLHKINRNKIITHRAHRITLNERGGVNPYEQWDKCINPGSHLAVYNAFPTGVGGVLYPPGSLHGRVLDSDEFCRITPKNDDIWLWAMANINRHYFKGEAPYIVVENGYSNELKYVDLNRELNSSDTLGSQNVRSGGNDVQMRRVVEEISGLREVIESLGAS